MRPPDFPRNYLFVRQGRSVSQTVSCRNELIQLRSELEMLRLCGDGDSTQVLAALGDIDDSEINEIREILIDARHPATEAAIQQIDNEFSDISSEVNLSVLHSESRAFRRDVADRLRPLSLALAGQYADSANLNEPDPPSDTPASESAMTKKAKTSAPNVDSADHLPISNDTVEAALDAIESDLADLTKLADEPELETTERTADVFDTGPADEAEVVDNTDVQDDAAIEDLALAALADIADATPDPDANAKEPVAESAAPVDEPADTTEEPTPTVAAPAVTMSPMHHEDHDVAAPAMPAQHSFESSHPTPRRTRPPARSARHGAVENAIENLGAFLLEEATGLWTEARDALEEILANRDHIREVRNNISALHDDMLSMRKDIDAARRDASLVQAQIHNIRDDASRARHRADAAATDAQSACDRAVAAAREADVVSSHSKSLP